MEKIIEKIIEIEKEANSIVQDAKTKKEHLDDICKEDFEKLKQEKLDELNRRTQAKKAELEKNSEDEIRATIAQYEAETCEFKEKFNERADAIASEIFQKIVTL